MFECVLVGCVAEWTRLVAYSQVLSIAVVVQGLQRLDMNCRLVTAFRIAGSSSGVSKNRFHRLVSSSGRLRLWLIGSSSSPSCFCG